MMRRSNELKKNRLNIIMQFDSLATFRKVHSVPRTKVEFIFKRNTIEYE